MPKLLKGEENLKFKEKRLQYQKEVGYFIFDEKKVEEFLSTGV